MKKIFGLILIYGTLQAGVLGEVVNFGKSKAKETMKEKAIDMGKKAYLTEKKERRNFEAKSNKKSTITELEDTVEEAVDLAKDTAKKSIGEDNIEFAKKSKKHVKDAFFANFKR